MLRLPTSLPNFDELLQYNPTSLTTSTIHIFFYAIVLVGSQIASHERPYKQILIDRL
jgi:hypothetical protein